MIARPIPSQTLRRVTPQPASRRPLQRPPGAVVAVVAPSEPRTFEELRRDAAELGQTGIHPFAVHALTGTYAALLVVFWMIFGGPDTALTLGVITVLGIMFFGLLTGGILMSDSVPRGVRGRSFSEFLQGRALIATGWISGREAFAQIILLPVSLIFGAIAIGLIWRVTAG